MATKPTYDWRSPTPKAVYDFAALMRPTVAQSVGPVIAKSDPRVQPYVTPPIPTRGLTQEQQAWLRQRFEVPLPVASALMLGDLLPAMTTVSSLPGFYSRLERAMASLPAKAHPSKVLSVAKNAASGEEIAWRGLDQFLASKGNTPVTKEEVLGWLAEHPLEVTKTVKGRQVSTPISFEDWYRQTHITPFEEQSAGAQQVIREAYAREGQNVINPAADPTRYATEKWTLPGGEAQRETLFQLPVKPSQELLQQADDAAKVTAQEYQKLLASARATNNPALVHAIEQLGTQPLGTKLSMNDFKQLNLRYGIEQDELVRLLTPYSQASDRFMRLNIAAIKSERGYRTSHWTEPNVLAWSRTNERTVPGAGKGRFLEEVQSDWHQTAHDKYVAEIERVTQGLEPGTPEYQAAKQRVPKDFGYGRKEIGDLVAIPKEDGNYFEVRTADGRFITNVFRSDATTPQQAITEARRRLQLDIDRTAANQSVPDAPFKEAWPDLALKEQLLDVANRPDLDWIGWTSGKTQNERWNLSKYVSRVYYLPETQRLRAFDHNGAVVVSEMVPRERLPDYIGKELTNRLLATPEKEVWRYPGGAITGHDLSGLDLEVGGEGMRKFYDDLLVKRMEKLVKPFGGKVERKNLRADLMGDSIWIVRLTPEMKAKIKAAGMPLLATLPFLSGLPRSTVTIAPSTLRDLQDRR